MRVGGVEMHQRRRGIVSVGKGRSLSVAAGDGESSDSPTAERMLRNVIDTIREPVVVLDVEFRVMHANMAFFATFAVEPAETIGRVLFALGDGQWDIAALRELLCDKLAVQLQLHDFEVDHVFPGIGRKIMLLNAGVISHVPRAERTILLAIEDVTERRFTEWRLAEHALELERSNSALDEFATVASHDLQEPLRKILSFGERLQASAGSQLDGESHHSLTRMLDAAARMRILVADVLAYAQVTTRVAPFTPTDLADIARHVIEDMDTVITDSGGRVEVGALPTIDADPIQMRQLVQNLLSNALKFARANTPPVVRISGQLSGAGRFTLTVSDNGIGFRQGYADQIFRMFERLNGRLEYPGSGIGLAICRKIVERHRGSIEAGGTPGHGATFTVVLPIKHTTSGT
jgi:signal transduction histidine kinase